MLRLVGVPTQSIILMCTYMEFNNSGTSKLLDD
jgi:hypothetical protein